MEETIGLSDDARNTLFVKRAVQQKGAVTFDRLQYLEWSGPGSAAWKVSVPSPGRYRAALCCAVPLQEPAFEIAAGHRLIKGLLPTTDGIYADPSLNFEKIALQEDLVLDEGETEIVLQFPSLEEGDTLRVCHLELTPEAREKAILTDEEAARRFRVIPRWFKWAGYGLMFHWTSQTQPRIGPQLSYHDAVAGFDVFRFAEMVRAAGAGYVMWTVNHAEPHCPAPIASWEALHPGRCTSRDLIGEIGEALQERGIKLMLYVNSPTLANLEERDPLEYIRVQSAVVGEIGQRYGSKVAGFWFDSWYQAFTKYGHYTTEEVQKAARVGNPERIAAFNYWIFPVCSPWQDYWAGEVNGFGTRLPSGPILVRGAGKGYSCQAMLYLEEKWVHNTPNSDIPPPRLSERELIDSIKGFMAMKSVITLNVQVYQDGTIGERTFDLLQVAKDAIRR